jgi:hypothetical protein
MVLPVRTVETRLRRGLARLRGALDTAHAGERRAWALGLAALVPLRVEAAPIKAAVLAGVAMGALKTVAAAAAVGGIAFYTAWTVKPAETARAERTPPPSTEPTVPLARYEALEKRLQERNDELEKLRAARKAAGAAKTDPEAAGTGGAATGATAREGGPRFLYGEDTRAALEAVDWDAIGTALSKLPGPLSQFAEQLLAGKSIQELGPLLGELQEQYGPLLKAAFQMQQAGVPGTGVNGTFTHPAVVVNMIHAALAKADMPLSAEQQRAIEELGRRFTEEDRARRDGYDPDAGAMGKFVDEVALKDRFFKELFGTLSTEQGARLRPESVRGYAAVDLFGSALMFQGVAEPLQFADRAALEQSTASRVMERVHLDASKRSAVEAAVKRWSAAMPDEYLNVAAPPLHKKERLVEAARRQAALFADLERTVDLTPEQLATLRSQLAVLVPYKQ